MPLLVTLYLWTSRSVAIAGQIGTIATRQVAAETASIGALPERLFEPTQIGTGLWHLTVGELPHDLTEFVAELGNVYRTGATATKLLETSLGILADLGQIEHFLT